jgi:hypothetical protein
VYTPTVAEGMLADFDSVPPEGRLSSIWMENHNMNDRGLCFIDGQNH